MANTTSNSLNNLYFIVFYATFVLSMISYGFLTFEWMDELLALMLLGVFCINLFGDKNWNINKSFLFTIGVFLFYFFYSIIITSNVLPAIITDTVVQFKPYFAFFATLAIAPKFNRNQKYILKTTSIIAWIVLALLGIASIFKGEELLTQTMQHPVYYSAAIFGVALIYYLTADDSQKTRIFFLIMLSFGIISGRSKFFGLFVLSFAILFYLNHFKKYNVSLSKKLFFSMLTLLLILLVAKEKIIFYFGGGITGLIDEESVARFMLYYKTPEILMDHIPFGTGFASYGTYSSGVYYSDIYAQYDMDGIWGISKAYYSFIADTYYPALTQFGFAGIGLYLFFWFKLLIRSLKLNKIVRSNKLLFISILIIGYFGIEGIADSTITSYRGFFVMMCLGIIYNKLKTEYRSKIGIEDN